MIVERQKGLLILGIETSCDDTCVAVYDSAFGLLQNVICTQEFYHNYYGGVIPRLAYGQHKTAVKTVLKYVCLFLKIKINYIFTIVYTNGPGLYNPLTVGASVAQRLGVMLHIPVYSVNHLEGHVFSSFLGCESYIRFPHVSLVASGGHTLLVTYTKRNFCVVLGSTKDDAVGEVFDKLARYLGFGYPGGSVIEKISKSIKPNVKGIFVNMEQHGFNFSFSGLKTCICKSIQNNVITLRCVSTKAFNIENMLLDKLHKISCRAVSYTNTTLLTSTGGVCANKFLANQLRTIRNCFILVPELTFSGDNAAMLILSVYVNLFK